MSHGSRAVAAVPREDFIPDTIFVPDDMTGALTELRRSDDPQLWLEFVRQDRPVITAVERESATGGPSHGGDAGGADDTADTSDTTDVVVVPTSSSSAPHMMARMVDALDCRPGLRVLEIGTGTGYNAAVLSHVVGAANVTTVEVEPDVAAEARRALDRAGYPVEVVTGDGTVGYAPNAPYDRVIATAAVSRVPRPWVEQTRAGGVIVTPWGSDFGGNWLLRLRRGEDGACVGRIGDPVAFIWMRHGRVSDEPLPRVDTALPMAERDSPLDPRLVDLGGNTGMRIVVGTLVPDLYHSTAWRDRTVWLADGRGSQAAVSLRPHGASFPVRHGGPRDLWAEVEAAMDAWIAAGRPTRSHLGLTVTPEGDHQLWADTPDAIIAP